MQAIKILFWGVLLSVFAAAFLLAWPFLRLCAYFGPGVTANFIDDMGEAVERRVRHSFGR